MRRYHGKDSGQAGMTNCAMKRYVYVLIIVCGFFLVACGKKGDPGLPITRAPQPAKRFQSTARTEGIFLLWKAPDTNADDSPLLDLSGFKLFRSDMPFEKACEKCPRDYIQLYDYDYKGPRGQLPEKKLFYYQDAALQYKHLYTYRLRCYNEKEVLGPPTKPIDVFWDVPPAPPVDFKARRSNKLVILEWTPPATLADGTPAEGVAGYTVYRTEERGVYEQAPVNDEPLAGPSFEDVPDKIDVTYFYTVRSVRKVRETLIESAPSPEIEVAYADITPPGVPEGLTAIPSKEGMLLKWIPKAEKDFAGFNIYRKDVKGERFVKLNEKPVTLNEWVDKTAEVGKRYTYGVTSVDRSAQANESAMSETVEVMFIFK